MYDPAANYIYGVISRRLGRSTDAKETLRLGRPLDRIPVGRLSSGWPRSPFWKRDFDRAEDYARGHRFRRLQSSAYEVLIAALRMQRKTAEAEAAIDRLLDFDPLDHQARFERYLLSGRSEDVKAFQSMIRNELPHETYLEVGPLLYPDRAYGRRA